MPALIACLSTGKGTWTEVITIMNSQQWSKIFLIANAFAQQNFIPPPGVELVPLNTMNESSVLVEEIKRHLQGRVTDFEVGLNLASGSGKEHMALLEAVLELGMNFRLVTANSGKAEVLGLRG